ncbi:MAG TPA: ATP-binding protein [Candidatus Acidoferrales bacterium]|nr:ATP-binding protein [Candidatus Acidoferrales bacterium]
MANLLQKMPTILVLAVLVGTFISLRKHSPSVRTRLWIFAWTLIFLHFFVQIFETHTGFVENIIESVDLAALDLAGVIFLVSLARSVDDHLRRNILLAILGPAATFHSFAITFGWQNRWALSGALAIFFFGIAGFALFAHEKRSRSNTILALLFMAVGIYTVRAQWKGDFNPGVHAILAMTFGVCGFLYWMRFPRRTAGVMTVSGGFYAWGAIFPIGALVDQFYPHMQVNQDLWNVPKFIVALGMILSALEEKSRIVEENGAREHAENALLTRFSRITSRLLSGADPATVCSEATDALTETVGVRRAAVILAHEDGLLVLAGSSGFSPAEQETLGRLAVHWSPGRVGELCAAGQKVASNSFQLPPNASIVSDGQSAAKSSDGSEIVVPLVTRRGTCLGWIVLLPIGTDGLNSSEVMKVEMLAADLAVTIENTRLHHQLVRSEKLAALGQLVAGVAHELNNPLTGIIGYSELLAEQVKDENASRKVAKLGNEARRMHRILSGLLRFARQNNSTERASNFEGILRDVLQLREFHVRKLGIDVQTEIDPILPPLSIGEDELKQILLNLLNNSCDSLEESRKRVIRIHASRRDGRVIFGFEDSGPGFLDLNRAFDPFYTTKPVGKGTGLGLSICYGIVRECGGDVHLANRQPYGASVTVEVPVATGHGMIHTTN